jgi:pre-mRNA cleavage complex 2 protein Pcf11
LDRKLFSSPLLTFLFNRRQTGSYSNLYCGIQCSTCGLRFPPEQTLRYSQHLDWHFRQNRREKDSAKKAQSRKWYYDVSDWIQFEEIEDLEDRGQLNVCYLLHYHANEFEFPAQSWFETQEEDKPEEVEAEIPTVLAGENNSCEMCHELFEQFYNNEKDEWHFRDAIRVDDKVYHPHCYQDLQV